MGLQQKKTNNISPLSQMNRIKSVGSNTSNSEMEIPKEKVPKIYVENKLNKTKSLNLWNNNIVEDMKMNQMNSTSMDTSINMNGLGLGLGLGDISEFSECSDNENLSDLDMDDEPMRNRGMKPQKSVIFDIFEEYKKMEFVVDKKGKE